MPVDVSVIIITTTELLLTREELLDRLAQPVTPPRLHKHRTCGVLASNARLSTAEGVAVTKLVLLRKAHGTRRGARGTAREFVGRHRMGIATRKHSSKRWEESRFEK